MSQDQNPPSGNPAAPSPLEDPVTRQQTVDELREFFIQLQADAIPPPPPPEGQTQAPDRTVGQTAEQDLWDLLTQLHARSIYKMIEVYIYFVRKYLDHTFEPRHLLLWNELIERIVCSNDFSQDERRVIIKMLL